MVNFSTIAQWFVAREGQTSASRGWTSPAVKFRGYEIKLLPVVALAGAVLIFARMLKNYLQSKEETGRPPHLPSLSWLEQKQLKKSKEVIPSDKVEQAICSHEERLLSKDLTIERLNETLAFATNFNVSYAEYSADWKGQFRVLSDRARTLRNIAEWRLALCASSYVTGNFETKEIILTIKKEALDLSLDEFKKTLGPILKVPKAAGEALIAIEGSDRTFVPAAIQICLQEIQSLQELIDSCTCQLAEGQWIDVCHAELRVLLGYTKDFPQTLDMKSVTVKDLDLALGIEIDFTNKDPTANECLRLRDFLEAHHKNFANKWKSLSTWFPTDSPDYTPTVGGDRFFIENSAFKAEMRRLLHYFSQAKTFYFGPSQVHKAMLLTREKMEELLEQRNVLQAFWQHAGIV